MMSKIEWCDITINPIVGCTKISEGCQNCYAEKMAYRLKCSGIRKYQDVVDKDGWTGKIGVDKTALMMLPGKPKKIFISSMGDFFHNNVGVLTMDLVFKIVKLNPQHTFIFLTKRIERVLDLFHPKKYLPNLWLGVTAENQKRADERIPVLLQIPAAVRLVSVEPMLERVDLEIPWGQGIGDLIIENLNWVICGPETGPKARPCKTEWIEDLYHQCKSAGVPFFDKRKTGWIAREYPEINNDNT